MAGVHVAMLRGINVGGKNRLPMAALVRVFEAAGARSVTTHIQSGNVVFRAPAGGVRRVHDQVRAALVAEHDLDVPVIVRTRDELAAAVGRNPFLIERPDPKHLHVAFLAEVPSPDRVAGLDPGRSAPDRFAVLGREVYLRLPNGVARTRLTNAWLDAQLGTVSTVRNWRTATTVLEMANAATIG